MLNMNFELQPETEEKMKRILEQYADKESFFQDIIRSQINEIKNGIHNIEIDLRELEQKYKLPSKDFYQQFKNGKLGDQEDFIIWSGIYEMLLENKRKLADLE